MLDRDRIIVKGREPFMEGGVHLHHIQETLHAPAPERNIQGLVLQGIEEFRIRREGI